MVALASALVASVVLSIGFGAEPLAPWVVLDVDQRPIEHRRRRTHAQVARAMEARSREQSRNADPDPMTHQPPAATARAIGARVAAA